MGWRGPTALAALALLGGALGYGASLAAAPSSTGSGVAAPVAAEGALPAEPQERLASDPKDDPLEPDVPLEPVTLGSGQFALSVEVPAGWTSTQRAPNEWRWKAPGTSNNTYVLRVEQLTGQGLGIADAKAAEMERLDVEQDDVDFVEPSEPDALEYTYTSDERTRRHSFVRWVDVLGRGEADLEVVVHGREADVPGTSDLVARTAASASAG